MPYTFFYCFPQRLRCLFIYRVVFFYCPRREREQTLFLLYQFIIFILPSFSISILPTQRLLLFCRVCGSPQNKTFHIRKVIRSFYILGNKIIIIGCRLLFSRFQSVSINHQRYRKTNCLNKFQSEV